MPATCAAAVNRDPIICADNGTTRSAGAGVDHVVPAQGAHLATAHSGHEQQSRSRHRGDRARRRPEAVNRRWTYITAVQIRLGTLTRTSTSRRPLAESLYVPRSTRWNTPEYESPTFGAPPG